MTQESTKTSYEAKSFTFWVSYYDVAQELTPKEQGEFYKAIMDYIFLGVDSEADLRKSVRICFKAIKANLKRSIANRRQNGNESGENRGDVPQPENALNLNLNSNLKKRSAGAGSVIDTPPAACPKCGGVLTRTAMTINAPKGKRRIWRCEKCGEEVEAIG